MANSSKKYDLGNPITIIERKKLTILQQFEKFVIKNNNGKNKQFDRKFLKTPKVSLVWK